MSRVIYEDPASRRVTGYPYDEEYSPSGCGVCGVNRRDHYRRWSTTHGWHGWRQPTDEQVLFRMVMRRYLRGGYPGATSAGMVDPRPTTRRNYVTTLIMADMSTLAPLVPADNVGVLAFYIGGNTPEVPTLAQVKTVGVRYWLPVFTRSDPQTASATDDANAALTRLKVLGAPSGITVGLDLETAVDPNYVSAFSNLLDLHDYAVLAYGSKSTLFRNPEPYAGYWVADYTNQPHLYPGTVATQYADATMAKRPYDLSVISATVKLWDTQPVTTHPGQGGDPHVAVLQELLNELGTAPKLKIDGDKGLLTKGAFVRLVDTYGTLESGDTGSAVKLIQAMLNTWWLIVTTPPLAIDGDFGAKTLAAVEDFQLARKVKDGANGQVGPYTKAALAV